MSSLNHLNAIDQQLLTDLTAEQSAIVEGGAFLYIQGIQAIVSGADPESNDDTYMTFTDSNGKKTALGETSMATGAYKDVSFGTMINGVGSIQLFDSDWWYDDYMGGFNVSTPTNGLAIQRVSGSGSTYDVYYSVFG
jgi:hypothetical protein